MHVGLVEFHSGSTVKFRVLDTYILKTLLVYLTLTLSPVLLSALQLKWELFENLYG